MQICRVWLDQIEHCHVNTRLAHVDCGHFVKTTASGSVECEFCCCSCEMITRRAFHLKITVADESGKVFAWCTGQTASEILQISPDEFYELPEVFFCFTKFLHLINKIMKKETLLNIFFFSNYYWQNCAPQSKLWQIIGKLLIFS